MNRQGISPVIATVLLITLGLVLASIIFLWARGFVAEKTQKFGEPVENACERIIFDAEVTSGSTATVALVNRAVDVPLAGVEVYSLDSGKVEFIARKAQTIRTGETGTLDLGAVVLGPAKKVLVTPLVLGLNGDEEIIYSCDRKFGQEVTVQ